MRAVVSAPRTVVLVEDDELAARGIARALNAIGYEVLGIAATPETARETVLRTRPAVLLVDGNLGVGSGFDLATELVDIVDAPVLFLTALDDPDLSQVVGHDGVFAFLPKPFTTTALHIAIELLRSQYDTRNRLRTLERHYHALFEHAAVGVAEVDATTGRVTDMNRTCAQIFHSTVEQLVGTEFLELARPESREHLRLALASGQRSAEVRGVRSDGANLWIRVTASPIANDARHHVVVVDDITERQQVLSANRAKTDFLANMSHELRTPLNAVLGLSEALLERTFGPVSDEQAEALATIYGSGRHLLDLINDVLDIARVESGQLPIDVQQTPLRPLLEESLALVYPQAMAKGQRVSVDLPRSLPPVDIDRKRIKQVLLNLLGNALKFCEAGMTISLRVVVDAAAHLVRIAISDDGPGVAPENLTRIFEPFVTLDPSMSRVHDGAGLGLSLAKRIVELHLGRIEVTSQLGAGSTFTIVLPCSSAHTPEPSALTLARSVHGFPLGGPTRTTLLLAEDNEATVFAVRTYLERSGYAVRVVHDGISALAAADEPEVAAVLMDVRLAGLDGLEATRRIRALPSCANKPIIALTAHAMPGDEARCLAAGASAYMAKPVGLRHLVETIERLLEVQ